MPGKYAGIATEQQLGRVDKSLMEESYRRIWDEIASSIQPHVSIDAFQRWFAAIELIQADEIALTFQVPNTIYQLWIESNYLNLVQSATLSVLGSPRDIKFRVAENGKSNALAESRVERSSEPPQVRIQEKESEAASNHGMNPRNSFETFVVGSNNQFAHAARSGRRAVAGENLQPVVYLRRSGLRQDPFDAGDRPAGHGPEEKLQGDVSFKREVHERVHRRNPAQYFG